MSLTIQFSYNFWYSGKTWIFQAHNSLESQKQTKLTWDLHIQGFAVLYFKLARFVLFLQPFYHGIIWVIWSCDTTETSGTCGRRPIFEAWFLLIRATFCSSLRSKSGLYFLSDVQTGPWSLTKPPITDDLCKPKQAGMSFTLSENLWAVQVPGEQLMRKSWTFSAMSSWIWKEIKLLSTVPAFLFHWRFCWIAVSLRRRQFWCLPVDSLWFKCILFTCPGSHLRLTHVVILNQPKQVWVLFFVSFLFLWMLIWKKNTSQYNTLRTSCQPISLKV